MDTRTPLLYVLHSGNLYGTERMALATLEGLQDSFAPVLFAPPGPAIEEGLRLGIPSFSFSSPLELLRRVHPYFWKYRRLAFVATGVVQSAVCILLRILYWRRVSHLHIVHGGTDERLSYGRKRHLAGWDVTLVAVSEFVREKLKTHRVPASRIEVIENFLPDSVTVAAPRREALSGPVQNVIVVSRIDPIKRIDLLLDALDEAPDLGALSISILGTGWDLDKLRKRAAERNPNVDFVGFCPDVAARLAKADLLVHLCPEEPFGLAILEAMVAGIPILVPDSGGAGSLIEDGVTGFRFKANSKESLVSRLREIVTTSPETLNQLVVKAAQTLNARFSPRERLKDYQDLIMRGFNE
ncbi:MAG: glycosyltransferase family 4 protein [Acidobacteriota bacterium]|nr:MAG: glycosyltransferase family 4 protein [Acidobacteriota bacterium]